MKKRKRIVLPSEKILAGRPAPEFSKALARVSKAVDKRLGDLAPPRLKDLKQREFREGQELMTKVIKAGVRAQKECEEYQKGETFRLGRMLAMKLVIKQT